ncbi:MAG: flagellar hook-length control protein FliK [Lachnospiraceae bacterium]
MKVNESTNATNLLAVGVQAKKSDSENFIDFANVLSNASDSKISSTTSNKDLVVDVSYEKDSNHNVNHTSTEDLVEDVKGQDVNNNQIQNDQNDCEKETISDEDSFVNDAGRSDEAQLDSTENMEQVIESLSCLLNEIAQILNISLEDLAESMEKLGFTPEDLLNGDSMKQLFLTLKDADTTDLIMNEELNNQFQELLGKVDEFLNMLSDEEIAVSENVSLSEVVSFTVDDSENGKEIMSDNISDNTEITSVSKQEEPVVVVEDNRNSSNQKNESNQTDGKAFSDHHEISASKSDNKENPFENPILQNIQDSFHQVEGASALNGQPPVSPVEIINQIVEQVKVQMNQDNTSLQMQLYPEHLGKIQINVIAKEGIMTAQIIAENDAAKQAIEGGLASLKETLESQNIKVDAIEVMVSTTGFQQNDDRNGFSNEQPKGKKNRKLDLSAMDDEELSTEDAVEVEKMKATGSSVSYSV